MIHSAEEFARLRTSTCREEYLRAAHEPAAAGVWIEVIKNFPDMKFWVAHNKSVPLEILEILSSDPDPRVRSAVAMKNRLPYQLMLILSSDPDESVRHRVAYNKKADASILTVLSRDASDLVSKAAMDRLSLLQSDGKTVEP